MDDHWPPLHILVLTDRDWSHPQAGGTGTNLLSQVSYWLEWGHRVSVIACGYPGAPRHEDHGALQIHRMGGRSTVFPHAIWRQSRGFVEEADVVLEIVNGITFLTPLWCRTPTLALVHHIHRRHYVEEMGTYGRLACMALETAPLRTLYRRRSFMTVSRSSAEDITAYGVPAENVEVNYNGIDTGFYTPGRKSPTPQLIYLGRLKRYKHIEELFDVTAAIPGAELDVVGDGEERPRLEAEAAERGLDGRVRFHGFVDDERKRELLQRAWVHLTASRAEGWSLTVMEAAACGTPTVAWRQGGLEESVIDGETGLLADDLSEMTGHTRRIVEDELLRERLRRAARERTLEFSWERTAARTIQLMRASLATEEELLPALAPAEVAAAPATNGNGRVAAIDVEAPAPGRDVVSG
jgi:glycosyltransferase involved in cell wall biosynthesis